MRHADPPRAIPPYWRQINVQFSDRDTAERDAIASLCPVLMTAESAGLLTSWFFIRKQWWRFRYLPTSDASAGEVKKLLEDAVRAMRDRGHAARSVEGIYEPETHAFGGDEGMQAGHNLFHADSCHLVEYLGQLGDGPHDCEPSGRSKRRELSLLLCAALMRAAGQDRYEQGDIWAKVLAHRPAEHNAQPERWPAFTAAVQRLITVDTGPTTALRTSTLKFAGDWLTAFEQAGRTLRALSDEGLLTRGIRAVTAHHILFHWNRIGLLPQAQTNMALAAKEGAFVDRQM